MTKIQFSGFPSTAKALTFLLVLLCPAISSAGPRPDNCSWFATHPAVQAIYKDLDQVQWYPKPVSPALAFGFKEGIAVYAQPNCADVVLSAAVGRNCDALEARFAALEKAGRTEPRRAPNSEATPWEYWSDKKPGPLFNFFLKLSTSDTGVMLCTISVVGQKG